MAGPPSRGYPDNPLATAQFTRITDFPGTETEAAMTGGADTKGAGLFKIPLDSGAPIRLTSGIALNPVWAADGSLIVYTGANLGGRLPLRAVRPDGASVALPDIKLQRDGERVRFLPTGSGLVYTQGFSPSAQDFWLLDLATKKSRPLSHLANTATMRGIRHRARWQADRVRQLARQRGYRVDRFAKMMPSFRVVVRM